MKKIISTCFAILFSLFCFAQDKVLLLSGVEMHGNILEHDHKVVKLEEDRKGKTKTIEIDTYRVFSVTDDGEETIYYKKDPDAGNYLTEDEMRLFIYGAQDARANYKGRWAFFSGLGVGAVGGWFLAESFAIIAVPIVYPILTSIHKIHPKEGNVRDPKYIEEPSYRAGYHKNTKSKRFFRALGGSVLGTAAAAGAFHAVN